MHLVLDQPCGPVLEVPNGSHNGTINGTHALDEVVEITCNTNFLRVGPATITCMDFGQWSSVPPTCEGTQLAFYVNLHRAVIGPSATLTGR